MFHVFTYIGGVVLVNWLFSIVPTVNLPGGEIWPPASLAVGFVFVLRDYAQRAIGHKVVFAMLVGCAISWFMAGRDIALASMLAFMMGEFLDWAVYTFTGRPFSQRILLSSLISTPVDSIVFLGMVGLLNVSTVLIMTFSKLLGAFTVFILVRRRERQAPLEAGCL